MEVKEKEVAEISINEDASKVIEKAKKNKKDVSIELIRLIACLIVIGTHMALTTYNEVQVDWSRLFTKCFLADGVAIFFLITGFFISNGRSYKKVIVNTIKKVLIPSFLVLVIAQIFTNFLINKDSFMNCIRNFGIENIKTILSSIIQGEVHTTIPTAAHLWYVFSYIQIIIIFPVLGLLCKEEKENRLARRILIILSVLSILTKDVQKLFIIPAIGEIEIFSIIDAKILFILLGYELYVLKDKIKNNKMCTVLGICAFGAINLLRYKAESMYMIRNGLIEEAAFVSWDTVFGIISALGLFLAIYSLDIKNNFLSNIIPYLGSMTFGIYLVHFLIIAKIDIFRFEKITAFEHELLYMAIGTIGVFVLSFIIVFVIKAIIKSIETTAKRLKSN